ncbi:HesA/MoeB/ThiF family protein [Dactylosporangium siamense]|uniref:THIF-type NAD/FAD binding fold domain-containing protein n=1 Tax=Dactylosporangium siamense TaxID=685454 RepID=A0A919PSW7_9ACTN|nr:ThiF family adenylyltransferase [Dactylosporangium siamense]GIG49996.1 hypothetical protein Dsi01nite_080370 [Dactylosporangium siamense]
MPETDRFARQRLIPRWDQTKLAQATAVVVGVGALGNEVAKNLALAGIGRLVLCDPDTVSAANLSRSVLFTGRDVGRPKVDAAADAIGILAPDVVVEARRADLVAGVGMGELADAGVVLGCLDSRRARLQLLGRAAMCGARLVDGGTHPWGGEVRVRLDPAEPCHACGLTVRQRAEPDSPVSCDGLVAAGNPAAASILSTSLVGGWMVTAAARLLLDEPLPWRFLQVDSATGHTAPVSVTLDPRCAHHRPAGLITLADVDQNATVGQLMSTLPTGAQPLAWGVFSLPGVCYHCNGTYDPGSRPGVGTSVCPHCGSQNRPRQGRDISVVAPATRLADLGVAREEYLPVRLPEGDFRWLRLR